MTGMLFFAQIAKKRDKMRMSINLSEVRKMKIVSFIYCENTQDNNGKTIINGPLQMISLKYFPSTFSFYISMGLFDVDPYGFNFDYSFVDPDGKPLNQMTLNVPPLTQLGGSINESVKYGLQINLGVQNLEFTKLGEHKTIISFSDGNSFEFPIEVLTNE